MQLMGIGDEAAKSLDGQIRATRELGWGHIEMRGVAVPGFAKANFHDIPDEAFDLAARNLSTAGIEVYCFGSTVMNWSRKVDDPFELTLAEVRRAIPRMRRLGSRYVRLMSFKPGEEEYRIPAEVFRRVKDVSNLFLDAGLQPVHENCMNYGGMSWQHALELLDKCPGLKWVFDTANPVFNPDRSKPRPWPKQDPWEFWEHVRDHVAHIHVKDATWNPARNDVDYTWPGEGGARVPDILKDALGRGYNAGISIEPHMVVVFHETQSKADNEDALLANFIEYGRRLRKLIEQARPGVGSRGS
jgi:sugar phosphate isomerase/epimerase